MKRGNPEPEKPRMWAAPCLDFYWLDSVANGKTVGGMSHLQSRSCPAFCASADKGHEHSASALYFIGMKLLFLLRFATDGLLCHISDEPVSWLKMSRIWRNLEEQTEWWFTCKYCNVEWFREAIRKEMKCLQNSKANSFCNALHWLIDL